MTQLREEEMRPYGLRRSIRCPKKYGETTKERKYMLAPSYDLVCEGSEMNRLDVRYVRNAAALPELTPPDGDAAEEEDDRISGGVTANQPGALLIHGFTVPEYRQAYHSVVDPLLFTCCGTLAAYSLQLGRDIKERLFKELAYPTLQLTEQPDGRVEVLERFCVLRPTPFIDVERKEDA